jgi:hypothetical protein
VDVAGCREAGTSTGVKETRASGAPGPRAPAGSRGCGGACRRRHTGSRCRGSRRRAGSSSGSCPPRGPHGQHADDVARVDDPGGDARDEAQRHRGGVAARGDAGGADETLTLLRPAPTISSGTP